MKMPYLPWGAVSFPGRVALGLILLWIPTGLAQDAELIVVSKSQHFEQYSPLLVGLRSSSFFDADDAPFRFEAFADASGPGLITAATLTVPGGSMRSLPMLDDMERAMVEGFGFFGEMESSFPPGTYLLQVETVHDGAPTVELNVPAAGYPGITTFTTFEAMQIIDPASAFTVRWNPIPGGSEEDVVTFEIDGVFSSPDIGEPGQLTGLDTEFAIPADTLEPGRPYSGSLRVFRPVDLDDSYPGVLTGSALGKTVRVPLHTVGGVDFESPVFLFSAPFAGETGVELNSIVTFGFSEAMNPAVDASQAIEWSGVPAPSLFTYSWSLDRQRLFCNYGPGLPLSTAVRWILNPPGSTAALQDATGNPLPEGISGEFTTSDVSNLGEPDVTGVQLGKFRAFSQDGTTPLAIGLHTAGLFAQLSGISTVKRVGLEIPGLGVAPTVGGMAFNFRSIDAETRFAEASDLTRIFPPGVYTVMLPTAHDGVKNIPLTIGADAFPNAPTVLNFATTGAADANQPLTLRWDPMVGGTSDDVIAVYVGGENAAYFKTPPLGEPGALDGTVTSITIPAGTLPPGRQLDAELVFIKVVDTDTTTYPGVEALAAFASVTLFQIQTSGNPFRPQLQVTHNGTQARVTVTAEVGRFYLLNASPDLLEWFPVGGEFLTGDGNSFLQTFEFVDDVAGIPQRFYQAVELPLAP